ncbi:MAG: L,D-transpeptidase family protein [Rhodobacteraceae bacterium]|nr:L,D-transpeptidase family protein [Paracoccaceae bacterium]
MASPNKLADRVVVEKAARRFTLYRGEETLATYTISLGFAPEGDKRREGDGKTPEGDYLIDYRNPNSAYHLSLHINYPSKADRAEAAARGEDPGGEIFIHGEPNGFSRLGALFRGRDWTAGCIAVTNEEMEEIWSLVPNGTPIEISP